MNPYLLLPSSDREKRVSVGGGEGHYTGLSSSDKQRWILYCDKDNYSGFASRASRAIDDPFVKYE